jgi:stearoyl-CoA desaturase (delta-9 desaturase)
MRFWLWLTTGMVTREWVAVHRKHHRFSDEKEDPHSPKVYGIKRVLFGGALLYHAATKDRAMVEQYGAGTPDDWVERNIYSAHSRLGVTILAVINMVLFGWVGLVLWGIQMIWIPFWAAGVVNGIGHWWGYKNEVHARSSRNIVPWGILIGGEELHANHHCYPASPKLSLRWFEFDEGWMWIRILSWLKLAQYQERTI